MNALTAIMEKQTKLWGWGHERQNLPEAKARSSMNRRLTRNTTPPAAGDELEAKSAEDAQLKLWLSTLLRQF